MNPDVLFFAISAALSSLAVVLFASALSVVLPRKHLLSEQRAWWILVSPLLPGAMVVAFLAGWATQEPDPANEWITNGLWGMAGISIAVILRAVVRSAIALRAAKSTNLPMATVGIFRSRTLVSETFRRSVSQRALKAALLHEIVHAKRRDPLRIWVGQFLRDLQWPAPGVRRRFDNWLLALEMQRDREAISDGASPLDLAEAVVAAARAVSQTTRAERCAAGLTDGGHEVALRVRRLIHPSSLPSPTQQCRRFHKLSALTALLLAFAALGYTVGDSLLWLVPGVLR